MLKSVPLSFTGLLLNTAMCKLCLDHSAETEKVFQFSDPIGVAVIGHVANAVFTMAAPTVTPLGKHRGGKNN